MDYVDAVSAAARALRRGEEANWDLAQLTDERTLAKGQYQAPGDKVRMVQWCQDVRDAAIGIKFSEWTGQVYKAIWVAYGGVPRDMRPSWTEAYKEVFPGASREATYKRHADKHLAEADPQRKRELIVRLLNDPDLADVDVLDQLAGLLTERRRAVRGMPALRQRRPLEEEEAEHTDGGSTVLRLAMALLDGRAAARAFADVLRTGRPLDAVARSLVRDDLARTRGDWDRLDALVEGGSVLSEIEAFLAASRDTADAAGE